MLDPKHEAVAPSLGGLDDVVLEQQRVDSVEDLALVVVARHEQNYAGVLRICCRCRSLEDLLTLLLVGRRKGKTALVENSRQLRKMTTTPRFHPHPCGAAGRSRDEVDESWETRRRQHSVGNCGMTTVLEINNLGLDVECSLLPPSLLQW